MVGGDRFSKAKEFWAQLVTLSANLGPLSLGPKRQAPLLRQLLIPGVTSLSLIPQRFSLGLSHWDSVSLPYTAFDLHYPLLSH